MVKKLMRILTIMCMVIGMFYSELPAQAEGEIKIYWDGADSTHTHVSDIEIENHGATAEQWGSFIGSLIGAELDFSDGPNFTSKYTLTEDDIEEVVSGQKVVIHNNTNNGFITWMNGTEGFNIDKAWAEIYIGNNPTLASEKHSSGSSNNQSSNSSTAEGKIDTDKPLQVNLDYANKKISIYVEKGTDENGFFYQKDFSGFCLSFASDNNPAHGKTVSLSQGESVIYVINDAYDTMSIPMDKLSYIAENEYYLFLGTYNYGPGGPPTVTSYYELQNNNKVHVNELNLRESENYLVSLGKIGEGESAQDVVIFSGLNIPGTESRLGGEVKWIQDRQWEQKGVNWKRGPQDGQIYISKNDLPGGSLIGDYTIIATVYGEAYKSYNQLHFSYEGNIDGTITKAAYNESDKPNGLYPIYYINLEDPQMTLTAGGYKFYIEYADGTSRIKYCGINFDSQSGKYYININSFSDNSYTGKITKIIASPNTGGQQQSYAFGVTPDNPESEDQSMTLVPQISDITGACKIDPTNTDMSTLSIAVDCRKNNEMKWAESYENVTKEFPANAIYILNLSKGNKTYSIRYTGGKDLGNGVFLLNSLDVNSFNSFPAESGYNVDVRIQYSNPYEYLKFGGKLYQLDDKQNLTDNIDLSEAIVNRAPDVTARSGQYTINNEPVNGLYIECSPRENQDACTAYFNALFSNENTSGKNRSELRFYENKETTMGRPFVALSDYQTGGHNLIQVENGKSLFITETVLKNISITKNKDYRITLQVGEYTAQDIRTTINYGVEAVSLNLIMTDDDDERCVDADGERWAIIESSQAEGVTPANYFPTVKHIIFNTAGSGVDLYLTENNSKVVDGKLYVKSSAITARPENTVTVNVYSNVYSQQDFHADIHYCNYSQPGDLSYKVETGGIRVRSEHTEFLNKITDFALAYRTSTDLSDETSVISINDGRAGIYSSADKSFFIPLSLNDIENIANQSADNAYSIRCITGNEYVTYLSRNTYSLNPIVLAGVTTSLNNQYQQDKKNFKPAEIDLESADEAAKNLNNGYVVTEEKTNTATTRVEIDGALAGAITSNNSGALSFDEINGTAKEVKVFESVTPISENVDDLVKDAKLEGFVATEYAFDVKIKKDDTTISEMPYPVMLKFAVPDGNYKLVTKHNGEVKVLDVKVVNGNAISYTSLFSSFVLVKDTTTPAPEPSKKSSSSGSSSSAKTDSVVTCQMAGYPANYAWNEAAKACQPGYLDANGVFRSTARAGVPNTYDKGLKGSVISLVTATVFAFFAAVLLKKY